MGVCNRYLLIWYSGPACCMYIDNECDCIVMCGYNVLAYLRAANFSSRCMKLFLAFCIFVLHIISWNGPRYDTLTHIHQFLGRPSRWTWIIQLSRQSKRSSRHMLVHLPTTFSCYFKHWNNGKIIHKWKHIFLKLKSRLERKINWVSCIYITVELWKI